MIATLELLCVYYSGRMAARYNKSQDRAHAQSPKQAAITVATRYKTLVAIFAFAFLCMTSGRTQKLSE
jgi:hypothetical protein